MLIMGFNVAYALGVGLLFNRCIGFYNLYNSSKASIHEMLFELALLFRCGLPRVSV